jgi:hypothetical protein
MTLQGHCSSILLQYLEQCAGTSAYLTSAIFGNINTIYLNNISALRGLCTPALQTRTDIQCFGCSQPLAHNQMAQCLTRQPATWDYPIDLIYGRHKVCCIRVGRNPENRPDVRKLGQITGRWTNRAGRIGPEAK